MTITTQEHCLLIGDTATMRKVWCIYEHFLVSPDNSAPPELIYIGACLLTQVFGLDQARENSDWYELTKTPRPIMVRIVATGEDRHEIRRMAIERIKATEPTPRCNLRGYNMHSATRPILCSNGQTYRTQVDAATALGISQSHLSRHLRGQLETVKGYTFSYMGKDD